MVGWIIGGILVAGFLVLMWWILFRRGRCPVCRTKLRWASNRYLMSGDGLDFCPNGCCMNEWCIDYMFGEYSHITKQWSGDPADQPEWVREYHERLKAELPA